MPRPAHDEVATTRLRAVLTGRVCIVGVGNRLRGDDAAGPRGIDERHSGTRALWLDAGTAPENHLETVVRAEPDTVLIVDAVAFGGDPGEWRVLDAKELDRVAVSTHAGSLGMLSDYLSSRSGARVWVLAIEPKRIELGEGLSRSVANAVREVARLLSEALAAVDAPTNGG